MTRPYTSYIAIGDSFSEGLADANPDQPGRFVGWADRLAHHLAVESANQGEEFRYANLAVRGRLIRRILDEQLPRALEQAPELISIVGGGNDLLRRGDPDAVAALIEGAVEKARAAGSDVLLATTTDTRGAGVFQWMAGRNAVLTANIWSIAQRHGCHVLDLWGLKAIHDPRMWAEDRLHLTAEGHHRVAAAGLAALHVPASVDGIDPLGPAETTPWRQSLRANGYWARNHLAPWVGRRIRGVSSGDAVIPKRPELTVVDPEALPPEPQF